MNAFIPASVFAAETDATGQRITLIVFGLVAVAATLALLTAWYWRVTDPTTRRVPGAEGSRGSGTQGSGGQKSTSSPTGPAPVPAGSKPVTVKPAQSPPRDEDRTRVLKRADILEPKSAPAVIDLRSPAASDSTPRTEPSVVDLTADADLVPPSSGTVTGAHDNGMSFDDWLAGIEGDQ